MKSPIFFKFLFLRPPKTKMSTPYLGPSGPYKTCKLYHSIYNIKKIITRKHVKSSIYLILIYIFINLVPPK